MEDHGGKGTGNGRGTDGKGDVNMAGPILIYEEVDGSQHGGTYRYRRGHRAGNAREVHESVKRRREVQAGESLRIEVDGLGLWAPLYRQLAWQ